MLASLSEHFGTVDNTAFATNSNIKGIEYVETATDEIAFNKWNTFATGTGDASASTN